jgi:hypothetical protein
MELMGTHDDRVLEFPNLEEERARRLKIEVERLARLPTVEWMFYVANDDYAAKYGVDSAALKKMVEAVLKEAEKTRQAELTKQRLDARVEKQKAARQRSRQEGA